MRFFLVENTQEHGMELNTFKTFCPQRQYNFKVYSFGGSFKFCNVANRV